jgi:hypothetical protein
MLTNDGCYPALLNRGKTVILDEDPGFHIPSLIYCHKTPRGSPLGVSLILSVK